MPPTLPAPKDAGGPSNQDTLDLTENDRNPGHNGIGDRGVPRVLARCCALLNTVLGFASRDHSRSGDERMRLLRGITGSSPGMGGEYQSRWSRFGT